MEVLEDGEEGFWTFLSEDMCELWCIDVVGYGYFFLIEYGSGVEFGYDFDEGDTCVCIAVEDGALYGCGAAPSW